jgi:hypothetical protein
MDGAVTSSTLLASFLCVIDAIIALPMSAQLTRLAGLTYIVAAFPAALGYLLLIVSHLVEPAHMTPWSYHKRKCSIQFSPTVAVRRAEYAENDRKPPSASPLIRRRLLSIGAYFTETTSYLAFRSGYD